MKHYQHGATDMVANQVGSENNQPDQYQAVLASFQYLANISDPIRAEFQLIQQARSQRLPFRSYRKMLKAWTLQQKEGQGNG